MAEMNLKKNIWIWRDWKFLAIERLVEGFESMKICQEIQKKP